MKSRRSISNVTPMSSWRIEFEDSANHDLGKLDSHVRAAVIEKLDWLKENFKETVHFALHGAWNGFWKLRVGRWRIVYTFSESKKLITVWHIDNRDKIYKHKK